MLEPRVVSSHHEPNAEDDDLTNNRRRLLARSDWLGLDATRPLHMTYQSPGDRDRIAKRRRVDKTRHRAKPAQQRVQTPLFDERLPRPDHVMSGALPQQEFRIKIGTDALASQTQLSRPSHSRPNTSMRQPSTEFGPLSEESMLMGSEADSFEVLDVGTIQQMPLSDHVEQSRADIHTNLTAQFRPPSPPMRPLTEESREDLDAHADLDVRYSGVNAVLSPAVAQAALLPPDVKHRTAHPVDDDDPTAFTSHRPPASSTSSDFHQPEEAIAMKSDAHKSIEDDSMWRNILHIKNLTSSHASVAAVKSSSLHNTTSSHENRSIFRDIAAHDAEHVPLLSTPVGAGTQGAPLTRAATTSQTQSSTVQSPSASLAQIARLAEQPAPKDEKKEEADQDESIWRAFIVGSDDGSSECSQQQVPTRLHAVLDTMHENVDVQLSPHATSGLGTSANATQGDTLFVTPTRMRKDTQQPHSWSTHDTPEVPGSPARTEDEIEDDIEDSESPQRAFSKTNIHAGPHHILSHKRFLPPKTGRRPVLRSVDVVKPLNRRVSTKHRTHDIYDLVDSDGGILLNKDV
ncbi:hypothetical protein LTR56_011590 [Elasticomyces elasticus]|nr:hypothetical protein LTR56_011590 [Elasticomyces elasticus]KAK3656981.1 hypothetical protein LTR22_009482 [Elasticomyces elasticus]KAK4916204.1 hypothetical protein LTR49_015709 [Elasticomyces elasticus]KAK5764259.1 hypothetical protein LTS12_005710 [Elasticomyces elasticus]